MPARTGLRGHPADYLATGEEWPHGRLVRDAPDEVRLVAGIVQRLQAVADGLGTREMSRRAGLSPQTVSNLLTGKTYGDVVTIARLERALDVELWGDEHVHGASMNAAPTKRGGIRPPDGTSVPRTERGPAKRARG